MIRINQLTDAVTCSLCILSPILGNVWVEPLFNALDARELKIVYFPDFLLNRAITIALLHLFRTYPEACWLGKFPCTFSKYSEELLVQIVSLFVW